MSCGVVAIQVPNNPIFSPPQQLYEPPQTEPESPSLQPPLKRKRPARIDIPAVVDGFGMETRRVAAAVEEVEDDGECYSVYCKRGRRGGVMEDRYSAFVDMNSSSKHAIFGVYDGHGGTKAAEFAVENLGDNIMAEVSGSWEGVQAAVRNAYLRTDTEFLKENVGSGACSVTALIHEATLVVSNVGDCRAVLSSEGTAEVLTYDHRASSEYEKTRIEASGGYVDCYNGVWRIQGSLAITRAIGDRHLKQWVIAEPETKVLRIRPEHEFLILASDGLWDVVCGQEAVDVVRTSCVGVDKRGRAAACKNLAALAVKRGSIDDLSVMVIQLDHFVQ